jgi:DNA polymerase I
MTIASDDAAAASTRKPRLVLVDGSGYIFRAYHALPPLTRPDGTPVGAVYGFTTMLLKLSEQLQADYLAVVFDAARQTFRSEIYAEYKANRAETPEDLVPQFALVREATDALGIARMELEQYEADDIIASYARQFSAECEVVIVSSDKDLMQLVNDAIQLYDPMKQRRIGAPEVLEKFGVPPDKVTHVQALIGDAVDNVPGVPSIGIKTAAQLIQEHGDLEGVLAAADSMKQPKRREVLLQHADAARLSFRLVTLKDDLPLPLSLQDLRAKAPDADTLLAFLQANNFTSLLKKKQAELGVKAAAPLPSVAASAQAIETHYELVTDEAALARWIAAAKAAGRVAIDTETTSLDAMQAQLVGVSLSIEAGRACYIPVGHVTQGAAGNQEDLFAPTAALDARQLPRAKVLDTLLPLLQDASVLKIGQNIKYDLQILAQHGVADIAPLDDTMLLSYVLAAGLHGHGMDELAQRHLGVQTISFSQVVGSGKQQKCFSQVSLEDACRYAAEDADITLRLWLHLRGQLLAAKLVNVYETLERPLIPVIRSMEAAGIAVLPAKLASMSAGFAQSLAQLEGEIYALAGAPFNVASPKQLGEVLYEQMGIAGGKKSSKTGAYATGAEVLEELAGQGHVIAEKVLQWRQLAKLKSTYTDALPKQINPRTGRVHTSFSMAATTTGRLSSSEPNLQNIPIRSEEGRRIREAFVAQQGFALISADYSQIELRLLAHIADIDVLKDAFKAGRDIHAATASQMFGVPLDAVDGELRRKAKTINFGIIYGISAHGLAARLGIGRAEAADYIAAYFEQYPGIRAYMEHAKEQARAQGYVETLFGRRVHVKDINAKNPNLRAFSERAAINAPLQGSAADIIKRAMIAVHPLLAAAHPQARLLLQVHDELIVEAPTDQAEQVARLLENTMSSAAHLSVPLLVEASIGAHWGAIH